MKLKEILNLTPFWNMLLSLAIVIVSVSVVSLMLQSVNAQGVETYENKMFGLKLTYPSDWFVADDRYHPPGKMASAEVWPAGSAFIELQPVGTNNDNTEISINIAQYSEGVLGLSTRIEDLARNDLKYVDQVLGLGPLTVDDKEAYYYSAIDEGERETEIYVKVNNVIYSFDAHAESQEGYTEMLPVFQQIIDSADLTGRIQSTGDMFGGSVTNSPS